MFERNTIIATTVVDILSKQSHPIGVKEVLFKLQEMSLSAHRTTVFRILKKLIQKNKISEIITKSGEKYYELKSDKHDHFICNTCNKIICLDQQDIVPSIKLNQLTKNKNLKIESHQLNVYGLCEFCE